LIEFHFELVIVQPMSIFKEKNFSFQIKKSMDMTDSMDWYSLKHNEI